MEVGHPGRMAVPALRHADGPGRRRLRDALPSPSGVPRPREHRCELPHHLPVDRERALVERGGVPRHPAAAAESGAGQGRRDQGCGAVPRGRARRRPRGDPGHRDCGPRSLRTPQRCRGDGRTPDPRAAASRARYEWRRKSHRDRHLIDRGRLRSRSVPRHHRDRQVDGQAAAVVERVLQHPLRTRRLRPAQRHRRHARECARGDRRDDERILDRVPFGCHARAAQAPGRRTLLRRRDGPRGRRLPVHRRPQQQQGHVRRPERGLQRRRHEPHRLDHRRARAGRHDRLLVGQLAGARRRERPSR